MLVITERTETDHKTIIKMANETHEVELRCHQASDVSKEYYYVSRSGNALGAGHAVPRGMRLEWVWMPAQGGSEQVTDGSGDEGEYIAPGYDKLVALLREAQKLTRS